jgi:tetratricopeptide (TPR) repeat protein
MSGQESFLLYFALLLALFAGIFSGYLFFDLRRRVAGQENTRTKYIEQLNNEMQSLKREHGHLNDAVARFRAQSLAGISETINESINEREKELGLALKESLEDNLQGALSLLSKEFDVALEAIVERVAVLEKRSEPYDGRADVQLLGRRLEQLEVSAARTKDLKVLGAGQVIDRFLASLDNPDERFRCLLASFDSVSDSATLGKLAVAYPGKNSWIILKELADHGVVSEVAAWAMIAGARLSLASGDDKAAQNLYQGARAAFVTCGGNHDGLWAVNTALARLTEGEASDNYNRDAMANLFALKSNTAQSTAPLQLAEFYQREDRLEVAAVLLETVAELHLELDSLAYQSSLRIVQSLGQVLLLHYQTNIKNLGEEKLFAFMSGALAPMRAIYTRCPSLEREAKVGLLVTMLYLARLGRDADGALHGAGLLMDQCQAQEPGMTEAMATDFADKIFKLAPSIYESLLVTLDALELSRKWRTMPLLARLTAAFMDTNNLSKASSCGAKLVDCALESHGDASVETISPIVTLAQVYRRMQRLDLVEECYRQILEIQYKVFSSESEEIVETLISLSDICRLQNNTGEADIFLESAIETGEELVRKEKSSDKLVTLLNRARTLKSVSDEGSVVSSDTNGDAGDGDDDAEAMPAESEEPQAQHAEQRA